MIAMFASGFRRAVNIYQLISQNGIGGLSLLLPIEYQFIWPRGFREILFSISANHNQESPMTAMFIVD